MAVQPDTALKMVVSIAMPGDTIAQNVFYAQYTGGSTATDGDVTADLKDWSDAMYTFILGILADTVSIDEIIAFRQVSEVPLVWAQIGTLAATLVGTDATESTSNGVAMVMRIATTALGSVARKYVPGLSEFAATAATWSAAAMTAGVLFGLQWLLGPDDANGRTYRPGIVSTKDGEFKSFKQSVIVSTIPGYQRRRKPGVGI